MFRILIQNLLRKFGYELTRFDGKCIEPFKKKEAAKSNLITLARVLDKHDCCWWLTSGTLLGAIRNNDFISHDVDTDIAIDWKSFSRECYYEIAAKFNVKSIMGIPSSSLEIAIERDNIKTDLFFVYDDGEKMRHSVFGNFKKDCYERFDYVYPKMMTRKYKFLDDEFFIPDEPEKYLECNYGIEWRIPVKNWCYMTSPPHSNRTNVIITLGESKDSFEKWVFE